MHAKIEEATSVSCYQSILMCNCKAFEVGILATRSLYSFPVMYMDTGKYFFICTGAFPGLESIVVDRLFATSIGYGSHMCSNWSEARICSSVLDQIEIDDLATSGLIRELIGCLPVIVSLRALILEQLTKILMEPKSYC